MANYKETSMNFDLLKDFKEKDEIIQNLSLVPVTESEIENVLEFHFSDFEEKCLEIRTNYEESGFTLIQNGVEELSAFFSQNFQTMKVHKISSEPFIERLNKYELGDIFSELLTLDGPDLTVLSLVYNSIVHSVVKLLAVFASLSNSPYDFFCNGSVFTVVFNLFVDSKYNDFIDFDPDITTNIISMLINISYIETQNDDSFAVIKENPYELLQVFAFKCSDIKTRYPDAYFLSEYYVRFFAEIAKHDPDCFPKDIIIVLIKALFDNNITSRSYYFALKFAIYVIEHNNGDEDIIFNFYELFKNKLFDLSNSFDLKAYLHLSDLQKQTKGAEIQFIALIFVYSDFSFSLHVMEETELNTRINENLETPEISQNIVMLLITMLKVDGEVADQRGKHIKTNLFRFYLTIFDDDVTGFINYIESLYDQMNTITKQDIFKLYSLLIEVDSEALRYIMCTYDFENLATILESGSVELSLPAIIFLERCIHEASHQSPASVSDLVEKFDDCDIPSIVEELLDNENEELANEAERLKDMVEYYLGTGRYAESD